MKKTVFIVSILLFAVLAGVIPLHAGEENGRILVLMWWNAENLFDVHNDPATDDDDFTPEGSRHRTGKKLTLKKLRIQQVLDAVHASPDYRRYPDIIAFAETENREVFGWVLQKKGMPAYRTVYHETPDPRGIDIGLAYNPGSVKLLSTKAYRVPIVNDKPTRHLVAAGFSAGGNVFHVVLNHWPSRAFDREWSEQKRVIAAGIARHIVDSLRTADRNADVIIMGDFNDQPADRSVRHVLGSSEDAEKVMERCTNLLYNCWSGYSGIGSYSYRNRWEKIDQILLSCGLFQEKGIAVSRQPFRCFHIPDMLSRSGNRPYATYEKGSFRGGYSDHLPLLLKVSVAP